ncbi:glutamine--tRNA ligase/YqeY domain fusion protein [Betaproteobacteria bacterium LSUCC0115]|nr:glutamine--tRNA ligase/YqeY domain fusion protein [Burkholderiales bacterium LSUCC0115]
MSAQHNKPKTEVLSPNDKPEASNFLRHIIEDDLAACRVASVVTRFPPEPNGYLHFGHAKSICLNFGLAQRYKGRCHLRLDDTNPTKEEQEFVDAIEASVRWLGFDWNTHLYFASDYFDRLYQFAEALIQAGHAYVDSQNAEDMRARRGTLTQVGQNSPHRDRSIDENLDLFRRMKAGEFPDGAHVLRAKINMASPNMNLRDPVLYRIRHTEHHRTGKTWCIYPLYDYAHPLSDAIEGITHSICTLEFEDHRPLYDWLVDKVAQAGFFKPEAVPHQYEFARLNLTYLVLSKRKLVDLIDSQVVAGWDDPRMPTLVAARRRGYTPEGFQRFVEQMGVSKSDGWIDYSVLEECMRDHLNEIAPRRVAVLDPLELVIENLPDDYEEICEAANHPQHPELGKRGMPFTKRLFIEHEDFMAEPAKGFFRMTPGGRVRLKYAYVAECTGFETDANGQVIRVKAKILEDSRSGTPGADSYKVKGNLHWVSAQQAYMTQVRLYDRLFAHPTPGARREGDAPELERDFKDDLNPHSLTTVQAAMEPSLKQAQPEDRFQFERHGYFVADLKDSQPGAPVFNRTVTLKDSWAKQK